MENKKVDTEETIKKPRKKKTNEERLVELEKEKEKLLIRENEIKKKIADEKKKELFKKKSLVYTVLDEGIIGFDSLDFDETEYVLKQIIERCKDEIEKEISSL